MTSRNSFLTRLAYRLSSVLFIQGFISSEDPRIEGNYSSTEEELSLTILVRDVTLPSVFAGNFDPAKDLLTAAINASLGADISAAVKLLIIERPAPSLIRFHIIIGRSRNVDFHIQAMH